MSNVTNELLLETLKALRGDIMGVRDDLRELKTRLSNVEAGQGNIIRHLGDLASADAAAQLGIDRLGERVARIERRLDLTN